jgi:hypothetical protein
MLVSCVAIYFICYSPIQFLFVSQVVFGASIIPPFSVILAMNALCYASSACNPILYTVFSTRFRHRFAQLLCAASACGQPPSAAPNWTTTRPRSQIGSSIVQCNATSLLISLPANLVRTPSKPFIRKRESQSMVQHHRPSTSSIVSSQSDQHICAADENVELMLILPIKPPPPFRAVDHIRDIVNAAEFTQA